MKAVMISIKPYWVFLIIAKAMGWGIEQHKEIEVRKNYPKADDWNKVAKIYCSKDKKSFDKIPEKYRPAMKKFLGKVIGEFVCDRIDYWQYHYKSDVMHIADMSELSCVSIEDLLKYSNGGETTIYGWHISNLVIYDEPKELSEFWAYNAELNKRFNDGEDYCAWGGCKTENGCTNDCDTENILNCYQCWADWNGWCHKLTRPPQSWCYVEEKEKDNEQ